MPGTTYSQREIILLRFPFADWSSTKKRPALVLSNTGFNKRHADLICCLITRNLSPDPDCVFIEAAHMERGHLPFVSKIKPYRLFTAEQNTIKKRLGALNQAKFKETTRKLAVLFG